MLITTKAKKDTRIFRSSLEQLVDIAEKIREKIKYYPKHLRVIKNSPFWNFYRPFHEGRLNQEDMKEKQMGLEHILNTFDPIKQVFLFEGKEFKSTAENLAVIFGLQRIKGGAEFNTIRHPQPEIHVAQIVFCKTYLKGEPGLQKKDIIDSLYATAEDITKPDEFVKLLVLYFCVQIFFPSKSGNKISKLYLNYIFAMDQVSWPDSIHSYLMEGLMEAEKPYKTLKGCTVYILFWFAEVTHFISKIEGELGNCKPRFVRWNTSVLVQKIKREGMTSLKQGLTGSFIDPLDEGEQSLMTPIEIRQANSDKIAEKMARDEERDENWELSPDRDAEELAPIFLSKKRKISIEESRPWEGNCICNHEPELLPSSEPKDITDIPIFLTQEFMDIPLSSVKALHGKDDIHIGNYSSFSKEKTAGIESIKGDATMVTSSFKCPTPEYTLLSKSTSVNAILLLTGSTSASAQEGVEGFVYVDNFKIPEEYEILYKKIYGKYGHIATKKVIKFSDTVLLACVNNLLKIISAMETKRGEELSEELLVEWEGFIKDAEALKFNIKWLQNGFNRLKNHWMSLHREVESDEQVLDAMQVNYAGLWTRRDELETDLSQVKIQIRKAEAEISSKREAIQEKATQKIIFQSKPVLEMVLD
ncbi:hypothetical protein C5167_045007 [Papaver somniferum]|uniref:Aminotransferase-like plant mobile domain-containing protein n=1 Tax=Papaver somniferum TaxID=3469 RepID=A0A4Y7LDE9_PAPSO|nr:uncharacterized protein LOC113320191 [Papaver somniferum]RZC82219.1 hypothetical protein C5167_045007 [Papaver somniferum]